MIGLGTWQPGSEWGRTFNPGKLRPAASGPEPDIRAWAALTCFGVTPSFLSARDHGREDDESLDDLLVVGLHVELVEQVVDETQSEDAAEGADGSAAAAAHDCRRR